MTTDEPNGPVARVLLRTMARPCADGTKARLAVPAGTAGQRHAPPVTTTEKSRCSPLVKVRNSDSPFRSTWFGSGRKVLARVTKMTDGEANAACQLLSSCCQHDGGSRRGDIQAKLARPSTATPDPDPPRTPRSIYSFNRRCGRLVGWDVGWDVGSSLGMTRSRRAGKRNGRGEIFVVWAAWLIVSTHTVRAGQLLEPREPRRGASSTVRFASTFSCAVSTTFPCAPARTGYSRLRAGWAGCCATCWRRWCCADNPHGI